MTDDEGYDAFLKILNQKVSIIKQTLGGEKGFEYIRDLYIEKTEGAPSDYEKVWRDTLSLALLNSSTEKRGSKILLTSDAYLYDLKGSLPRNHIVLEQLYSTSDYRRTRDTYAALTYYALAMDAKRMGLGAYIVTRYLQEAYSLSKDIRPRDENDEVALLIGAIQSELKSLKDKGQSQ